MTSEVVLMNRQAVALAADSATTASYWNGEKYERRYFKGANKIFHLSSHHPIGLMIYGAANLQNVPWEVIAKAYRAQLGDNHYDTVEEYSKSFSHFIENSPELFPYEFQKTWFLDRAVNAALLVVIRIINSDKFSSLKKEADKKKLARESAEKLKRAMAKGPFIAGVDEELVSKTSSELVDEVEAALLEQPVYEAYKKYFDSKILAAAGIVGVYNKEVPGLDRTGLVFAGYGENEYFPSVCVYSCYGIILGKCLCEDEDKYKVDHDSASSVVPMAKSDMIQTFVDGVGFGALAEIETELASALDEFSKDVSSTYKVSYDAKLDDIKKNATDKFRNSVFEYMFGSHTVPMRRVVSMLPIDELADLAETLIYMESLKERVTVPEESVSGPIDVAVISKGDGFIWIKRKHYFDAALNPRYFASQRHQK